MRIVPILATEHIDECWDLLQAHREELATHKDLMVLKPDVARYKNLEEMGFLFTLALLDDQDKIVGYSVNILVRNLHYVDLVMANNDILFIRKDLRKGTHGLRLIRATEESARAYGAKFMTFHGKQNTPFSELMPKIGYGVQDIVFSRVL